jgi:hypothetical protein
MLGCASSKLQPDAGSVGAGGDAGAAGAAGSGHGDAAAPADAHPCSAAAPPDAHPCSSDSDCGVGYACGYSIAEGCSAIRRCQQQPLAPEIPIAYCGCDGTVVETTLGTGYVSKPVNGYAGGTNSFPTCPADAGSPD